MKKTYYKLIILTTITVIILIVFQFISGYSVIKNMPNIPEHIDVINTGNSHGRDAFKWQNDSYVNFGISSQSIYYDYQNVKHYLDSMNSETLLVIPLSYYSLSYDQYVDKDNFKSRNELYYDYLAINEISEVNLSTYINKRFIPIVYWSNEHINGIFKEINNIDLGVSETALSEIGRLRAAYHKTLVTSDTGDFVLNNESVTYLNKLIILAKEKGIKVVLVTTPYLCYYNESWPSDFFYFFYQSVAKISNDYNIPFLDYSHDVRFTNDENLFKDTDHLNSEGGLKFTNIFLEDLKNLNLY